MVAIVAGNGLGLERSSALVLGSRAQLGSSSLGRANESVYVNAANGNLILTNRDEVLIGRGPDSFINRTYNSQGLLNDENGDNWRISTHRRVYGLTGTLNQVGSTVRRVDWDGSDVKYQWNGISYVSTAGSGAYDIITRADTNTATPWIWTDGDSQFSERYDNANGGRITERRDTERDSSGNPTNKIIYGYDASGRLNRVTTADGNFTDLVWDNTAGKTNNLLMLTTSYTDTQTNTTKYLTRTRYTYDASNRMETVTADLTPEHASGAASGAIADGRVYTTTYTYDGTSRRIASITQTDGTLLQFTYALVGSDYRISTFVQTAETGVTRTTSFVYDTSNRTTAITDPANVVTTITYDSAFNLVRQSVAPVAGGAEQITTYAYAGGATNLLVRSAELNNASWVGTSVTVLANDPARPAPNGGTNTAERLTFTGTNNKLVQNLSGLIDGVRYLADIWVYSATATTVKWGLLQGTQSPAIFAVAAGVWTRLRAELTYTAGSTSRRVELAGVTGGVIWATQTQVRRAAESDIYVETAGAAIIPTTISDDVTIIRRFDGASNAGADNWSEREDFTYDARGNLIKRIDGTGNTTEYSYTAANQRATASQYLTPDPDGVAGSGVASNPIVTRYVYDDASSNGVTDQGSTYVGSDITDVLEQHLRFLVSAEGRVTEYRYNAEGQLIATINYAGNAYTGPTYTEKALSDWVGLLTASDQMKALRVDYVYDFRGNIQHETRWSRTTSAGVGDAGQDWSRVDYVHDQYGLLLRKLESGTAAGFWLPNPVAETYVYDGMGRMLSFTDAGGNATRTSYLDAQSKTQLAFANGAITTSRYNRAGELISSIETTGVTLLNVLPASITGWATSGEFNDDGSGGPPRSRITIKNNTHYSVTSSPTNVVAGDQISWRITLRQIGTLSTTELWAWATASGYGTADLSSARIVDGPGNIAQFSPGKFTLQGLSQSDYTTIEVTRIFTEAEAYIPQIYTSMGSIPSANSQGVVVVNDMAVTKTSHSQTLYKYDNLGRLRVVIDPTGVKSHILYDQLGRKVGEVDGDGSLTEFKYDAADRVIASVRYATVVSAVNLTDIGDPNTTKTIANIRPSSLDTDRWSWNIYDKAGRLIQTIDAAGAIAVLSYDGAGRLTSTMRYATALSSSVVNGINGISGYRTNPPAQVVLTLPAADAAQDRVARSYYDNDGLLIGSVDGENFVTEYFYDKAGRKTGTIGYANVTSTAISASTSWSAVKSGIPADSTTAPQNIHNYWLYDGRGLVGAMVDGEGNVIRFAYSAKGQVFRETIGNKVDITAYIALSESQRTLADLDTRYTGSPDLDVTNFEYDVRNLLSKRQRILAASKVETTDYVYDSMGRLVSETVSETGSADTRTQRSRYDLGGRLIGSLGGMGSATLSSTPTDIQLGGAIELYGTRYVYDAAGRLTQKIAPQGNDATGIRTVYYYDQDGQLRHEINALGEVVEHRYNVLEDKSDSIVYGTRIAVAGLTGGLLTATVINAVAAVANSAVDSRSQFAYTNRGELNVLYNPLYIQNPTISNYSQFGYYAFGENSVEYNPTDTAGSNWDVIDHTYNRRGLKHTTRQLLNGTSTGAVFARYTYDGFGRVANAYENNTDLRGSSYNYDRSNRLTYEWEHIGNTGSYRQTSYDSRSNVLSFRDRTGNLTLFEYDLFNRNVKTTTAEGVVSTVQKNAYGQTIEIKTPGVHFPDGKDRKTRYTYDKNGNLKTVEEYVNTINSVENWRTITTNTYDNADRLFEAVDARGVITRYSYDAVGRVLSEIRDYGSGKINAETFYTYDAKGQSIRITDARGMHTDYSYDLKGQKLTVTQDVGGFAITTKYDYRADGKVSMMTEASGKPEQRITEYKYDTVGRLLEEIVDPAGLNLSTKYAYDVNNNVVSITDARNYVTRFVYDTENRQILSVSAQGEVVETGYDAEGRAIWNRGYVNRIAQASVDAFTLEVAESTVRASFAADASKDRITRTMYDGDGRRAYAIDGEGYVTRFKYDGANNIIKTVVYETAFTSASNTTSKSNLDTAYGNIDAPPTTASVTTFAYDAVNRLISTTDAEIFSEYYEYDAVGNRTKLTNKLNGITNFTYDNLNRVRTEYVNALIYNDMGTQTSTGYYKNQYEYDALGNVTRQVEGNIGLLAAYGAAHASTARETKFQYDKLGRLDKKTQDTFQTNLTPIETFAYDARGNLVVYTDPSLAKTYTYYDADDRKIASVSQINIVTGGQATYQSWSYDGTGNVKSEKTWGTLVAVPSGLTSAPPTVPGGEYRETTFEYDRNGRLLERRVANISSGSWNGTTYITNAAQTLVVASSYDAFGNLSTETDANTNVTLHWYDRNGRETAKVDANLFLTIWTRDEDGNVTWERRYATALASAPSINGASPSVADHVDDRITTFGYDKNGRRKTETRMAVSAYTVSGNTVVASTTPDALIQYNYNGLGEVTAKTEANGDVTAYEYDTQGRLRWQRDAAITDFNNNTAHRQTLMFFDALGNLVRSTEQAVNADGTYATGYTSTDDRITLYGYDKGRLAWTTDATNFTRNTKYDANSRVVEESYTRIKADGVTTLQEAMLTNYDLGGRVEQTRTAEWISGAWADQAPATTLTYTAYGEVSSKSLGGVLQEQFVYDLAGRVVKSSAGDGIWKLFGYDANGNATITITSAGDSLSSYANAAAALSAATTQEGINASYMVYDKRNMATQTVEEGRRLTATGALVNLTSSRVYNAFGEVTAETDARTNTTNYSYNAMGRMTKVEAPTVSVTSESGVVSNVRPTQLYYYDSAGRQIGTRDANGNLTTRVMLAGTGHEGSEALVTAEYRPDSSTWSNGYDAFRDQRKITDGLSRITTQSFDKAGRVTQITRPATTAGTLTDNYTYDGLGRKIKAWSAALISPATILQETSTDYDALGRVTSQRGPGNTSLTGDLTSISYTWNGTLLTAALGSFTGWEETTSYANGLNAVSRTDMFGREIAKRDMGGHLFAIGYDAAGRMVSRTGSAGASGTQSYTYFNTGQLSQITGDYGAASYGYNEGGNRVSEIAWTGSSIGAGVQITNATTVYDALGRMISWTETGSATTPAASTATSYDANGNIRRTQATHATLDGTGVAATGASADYWYRFDAVNRVTVDKGVLSGSTIVRGGGTAMSYDANGNRASVTETLTGTANIANPDYEPGVPGQPRRLNIPYTTERRTDYTMDAMGRLSEVRIASGGWTNNNDGTITVNPPAAVGDLRSSFQYDLLGRMALQQDYGGIASLPTTVTYSRSLSYNAKNQILVDDSTTMRLRDGSTTLYDSWRTVTRNDYDADGNLNTQGSAGYALGSIVWQHGQTYKNGSTDAIDDTMTRFDHVWWEGAVQSGIAYDKHYGWGNNNGPTFTLNNFHTDFTTSYTLNGFGQTTAANVNDGVAKTVAYTLDSNGQIVRRDETRTSSPGQAAPHEVFYRFAGKTMGMVGNNGTTDVSYDASITERSAASPAITATNAGLFRNGTNSFATGSYADFSQSLDPYNSGQQGSAGGGTYTVRTGDTLQGIAAALYGDGNLWYRIAEANGLSAGAALSEGQSLILPAGVTKNTHNASTFQPYDASEAMGDTLPTTPKPPKTPKCGAFGQILQTAVTIAITQLLSMTPLAPVAPILGNAAGQLFGMATGIQQGGFNWKSLGMTALTIALPNPGGFIGGALNNAAAQGIGVAIGLQDKFSWSGVAAAGVGSALSAATQMGYINFGKGALGDILATSADVLAQAATRSIIDGNSFGDNLIASLPSALGNLAGRWAAQGIGTAFDGKSSKPEVNPKEVVETMGETLRKAVSARPEYAPDRLTGITPHILDDDTAAELATGGVGGPGEEGDGIVRSIATPGYPSSPLVAGEGGPRSIRRLYEYLHQDDSIFFEGSEAYLQRRAELAEYIAINHLIAPTIGTGLSLNESLASYAANSTGFSFQEYNHENMLDPKFERTLFEDYVQPFFIEMSHDKKFGEAFGMIYKMNANLYSDYQQTGGYKHWQNEDKKAVALGTTILTIAAFPVAMMEGAALYAGITRGGPAIKTLSGLGAISLADQTVSGLSAGARGDSQTLLSKAVDHYFPGYGDKAVAGLSLATGLGSLAAYKFGFKATLADKPIIVDGKWRLPPGFRKPADKMGHFAGDIGDSPFKLSTIGAEKSGLPEGTKIPWRRGVPDFLNHVVAGPKGMKGQFAVNGLTGEHGSDKGAMLRYMAQKTDMTQNAVEDWLRTAKLHLHHAGGDVVQIVPIKIHKLHHSGGAQQKRLGM